MQVNKRTIEKFKEIFERKEGEKISDKEALELVTNLILVFEAIYKPIPRRDKERLNSLDIRKAASPARVQKVETAVK